MVEVDVWVYCKDVCCEYVDFINCVKNSFGKLQCDVIFKVYVEFCLFQYFNGFDVEVEVVFFFDDVKVLVEEMCKYYVVNKEVVWGEWMVVKMYVCCGVVGEEFFFSVLCEIKKEFG